VRPVYGDDYSKALCGAKLCLCFLSRLNRDSYTRRTFEIPACGRLMLSERTADLSRLFAEDREALFFSSTEELVSKVQEWVKDDARRDTAALAGLCRCWDGGHDVISRMREMLMSLQKELGVAFQ
jgi:spore maturation protein CgeB